MKILVACFSLTGKTELIAKKLAKSLGADYVSLEPVKWRSRFAAYTVGLFLAQRRKAVEILPLDNVDVDSYDCVVVAGPVWGGAPAPVLNGFIRQYQLEGKQTYGLLSCGLEGKTASKLLRRELEEAGTRCRSIITVKAEDETLEALEKGKIEFLMRENGKIVLQISENHRRKKKLTENQVQEMRDMIEAAETDDSAKKPASSPEKDSVAQQKRAVEKPEEPAEEPVVSEETPAAALDAESVKGEAPEPDQKDVSIPEEEQAPEMVGFKEDEPRATKEKTAAPDSVRMPESIASNLETVKAGTEASAPEGNEETTGQVREKEAQTDVSAAEQETEAGGDQTETVRRPADQMDAQEAAKSPDGEEKPSGDSQTGDPAGDGAAETLGTKGRRTSGRGKNAAKSAEPAKETGGKGSEEGQETGGKPKKTRKGRKHNEEPSSDD